MSKMKRGFAVLFGACLISSPAVAQPVQLILNYPPASLLAGEQGVVKFRVALNASGKPTKCEIVESSGYPRLDKATCQQIRSGGQFKPAVDADGRAIKSHYTGSLRWKMPAVPAVAPTP